MKAHKHKMVLTTCFEAFPGLYFMYSCINYHLPYANEFFLFSPLVRPYAG